MLNKIVPLLRVASRLQPARYSHDAPAHWKTLNQIAHQYKSHMNYLPVPEGPWQKAYSAKNAKLNLVLLSAVATFVGTYAFLWSKGVMYLHSSPPTYNCKK